jgi:hypothetical protein
MSQTNFRLRDTVFEGQLLECSRYKYSIANKQSQTSATRGAKAKMLTETVKRPGLEFVQVDDLIDSDLTEVLKGEITL